MWRTNLGVRACRKTFRQHKPPNGLASSIVPAGHRSADRRNPRFLLFPFYGSELVLRSSMISVTRVRLRHGHSCLLGRAERSRPVAAKRCVEDAGLDGECAHRAIIRTAAMRIVIGPSRSCRCSLFPAPAKVGPIHPHAVQDDREPPRHRDDRALHSAMPCNLHAPRL
jgi:hypothetical protein